MRVEKADECQDGEEKVFHVGGIIQRKGIEKGRFRPFGFAQGRKRPQRRWRNCGPSVV